VTILAVLRHGETAWSRYGRIQGRTDVPLSDSGRAALIGRTLPEEFRDLQSVTSPLRRCIETATLLGLGAAVREPRIAEMHWGAWEGRVLHELRTELGEPMRANESRGLDFTPPGGESPRSVLDRVSGWLEEIAEIGAPTIAVTHRGVIRVLLAAASNWDMRGKPPVKLDWSAIHVFRLQPGGEPALMQMNVPLAVRGSNVTTG